jgi:hypothetical protein
MNIKKMEKLKEPIHYLKTSKEYPTLEEELRNIQFKESIIEREAKGRKPKYNTPYYRKPLITNKWNIKTNS